MNHFLNALKGLVNPSHCLIEEGEKAPYLMDWWGNRSANVLAVVFPASTAEVAAVVRLCHQSEVAIVPQGGHTGLSGGALAIGSGRSIILNFSRMNAIRELDLLGQTMTLEAGCTLIEAQQAASEAGRLFPLSLGSEGSCQIGGNISTNAGGVAVLRYGMMRDLVLGLEIVLADGSVLNGLRKLRKDNTGCDLKQLFIGTEGTLGIVTAAVVKLFAKPDAVSTAWVGIDSVEHAILLHAAMREKCGDRISSFELISRTQLDLVHRHQPQINPPLNSPHDWVILVELSDTGSQAMLNALLESALEDAFDKALIADAAVAANGAQAKTFWRLRHSVSDVNVKEGKSISHDISVPISRIPEFCKAVRHDLEGLMAAGIELIVGHVGDGNLHYIVLYSHDVWNGFDSGEQASKVVEVNNIVYDRALSMGGSISAEHGIGLLHVEKLEAARTDSEVRLMRCLKNALDPSNVLNPGKILKTLN
ncbi:FAD-binding oxidoreductase [Paralcaligenes ureilyticus]|uniref:FAD/FMN-containing dehydrogenase n=1 Tax=Paralcaligenes ureilyticus TaxID=627131 RepID=A0A4R3LRN3_9BURK|nr:FAD-binding oxidoreductase [Paralcaligenes ureilyticus]TCT03070.1 FAD/FMN-containing dehydrogenase [Paralcaligenes ureilyticus]